MGIQVDTLVKGKDHYGKEFIDFEFDGKHISDFGMVAVFDGDRHTFSSTSEFEDETSEVAGVHGQYFWGTKLKPLEKEFSLATDGMTERQVNEFKRHFQPGRYGKFVECANSNRYNYARITEAVEFKMLPFKKEIPAIVEQIKTEENGIEKITEKIIRPAFYVTEYKGEATIKFVFDNPFSYSVLKQFDDKIAAATPEQLKIAYEDNIPFEDSGKILSINTTEKTATIYNPSTASAYPVIKLITDNIAFINKDGVNYISEFKDEFNSSDKSYSSIVVKENNEETITECFFSSPNIFYAYNQALSIIKNYDGSDKIELEEKIRDEVTNPKIVKYVLLKLNDPSVSNLNGFEDDWKDTLLGKINNLFDSSAGLTLELNGKAAEAKIKYNIINLVQNEAGEWIEKSEPQEENCGEIMRSPYLILDGGDCLDENFKISNTHIIDFTNSLKSLKNMEIDFEYTYI